MRPFEHHPAYSVEEAIELVSHYGEDVQLLSGGTSLMLLGKLGFLEPQHVVGLSNVDELRGIDLTETGELRIGSLTTLRDLETSPLVQSHAPGLVEALSTVATIRIRNQATIGGNLAHADPAQDAPPMLMALGASVEARGKVGTRNIEISELFSGYMETTLRSDEILTAVLIPRQSVNARCGYLKFLPRTKDDFATVSLAASLEIEDEKIASARVVFGAAARVPAHARRLESALTGISIRTNQWTKVTALASEEVDPADDARGTIEYKRAISAVCANRLIDRLVTL